MKRERHNLEECGRIRVWYSALKKETLSIRNGISVSSVFDVILDGITWFSSILTHVFYRVMD